MTRSPHSEPVAGLDVPSHALGPYVLITFGLPWGVLGLYLLAPGLVTGTLGEISGRHPLFILAVYAPAIAALSVVAATTGVPGLRGFLSRLSLWRCSPYWYGFLLVGIGAIYVMGAWLKGTLFTAPWPFTGLGPLLAAIAFMLVLGPVEEFGWRGVALPILQRRLAPLAASVVLGVVWGVWHLPAFFLSGTSQSAWGFAPFLVGAVAASVIVTPLFNSSGGSVLLAALFHFQLNNPLWPDAQPHDTIVFVAAALVVVALNRTTMFTRAGAVTRVVPAGVSGATTRGVPTPVTRGSKAARRPLARLSLGVCAVAATVSCAAAPAHDLPVRMAEPDRHAQWQSALEALHRQYAFPGATAAYTLADGTTVVAATGFADLEARTPMSTHHRMLAASIGKTFVAATTVALVRERVVDLDAPVSVWLGDRPWFPRLPNHDDITLRHLLTHTAGLPDHVHLPAFASEFARRWSEPVNPFPPDALLQFVLDQPPLFPAGQGWAYSDTGYILVGLVVEKATGQRYEDHVRTRFLAPLGLTLTAPSNVREIRDLAAGYTTPAGPFGFPAKTTTAPGVLAWHPGVEWTGGGLVSSAGDLARWGHALFEGRALAGPYLADLLRTVPISPAAPEVRYGAGVAVQQTGPHGPVYGHGGWIPGYSSSLRYYAGHRVSVAFQLNTDVNVLGDDTAVVRQMEARLADAALAAAHAPARR